VTTPTDVLPLLIVVFLLISAGGNVEEMTLRFSAEGDVTAVDDVLVVAGGETTVPANATVAGEVYVVGGTTTVHGIVDGNVTVLGGTLSVEDGGGVTETLQEYAGNVTVSGGASVGDRSSLSTPQPRSPAEQAGVFLVQFLVLALAGVWLARRHPRRLANVGNAVTEHALVSGVVGALSAVTLLVLFVYMAFTIVLLPVSIVGLLGEFLIVLFAYVVYGYWIGRHLPVARVDLATVTGLLAFMLAVEVLARVPVVGTVVQGALLAVGFGAVLLTYVGLRRFEPATIAEVGG
jgi:hypothetical protein